MKQVHEGIINRLKEAELNGFMPSVHTIRHTIGLPMGVLVAPGWTPVDGLHVILITPQTVGSYSLRFPTDHNEWKCYQGEKRYATPDQMIALTNEIREQARGCW